MTPRFEKAYNALVNAFFNGTLAKGTCTACAVGNIVADAQEGIIKLEEDGLYSCSTTNRFWSYLFMTGYDGTQSNNIDKLPSSSLELYRLTGYKAEELAKVEFAFETNTKIDYDRYCRYDEQSILEDQYKGLCAVVDVLLELDNLTNDGHKEKFRTHPKLITA